MKTIDEWICAIAKTGLPIEPFLRQIERSARSVQAFHSVNGRELQKGKLGNAFWEAGDPGYEALLTWFKSPAVVQVTKPMRD